MSDKNYKNVKWSKTQIPYTNTRLILGIFGAVPCVMGKPYYPSLNIKKSTFLYCLSFYTATSFSVAAIYIEMLDLMNKSYPYNHHDYIIAFQMMVGTLPNILTLISWTDIGKLGYLLQAWNEFMLEYEKVWKKPIPNCKKFEWVANFFIVVALSSIYPLASFISSPKYVNWRYFPAIVWPNIVQLSLAHYWIGCNITLALIADELSTFFKQSAQNSLLTGQLLTSYKRLWLLLRKITDKMNTMRSPIYFTFLQCLMATIILFEGFHGYTRNGNFKLAIFNIIVSTCYFFPILFLGWTSQTASDKLGHLFEDSLSELRMDSLSLRAQREIFIFYLIRRSRNVMLTICDYRIINQSIMARTFSSVLMYILILVQFHQMRMSEE